MPALTGYAPTDRLVQMYLGGQAGGQAGVAAPNAVTAAPAAPASGRYAGMSLDQIIGTMGTHGYTQEGVNAVYAMRGLSNPPTVPPSLEAAGGHPGRGSSWLGPDGKPIKTANIPDAAPWRDFTNTFGTQAVDPYRHRSGISNLAGGILNAVGTYVGGPVWQAFTGIADAGNRALGNNDGTSYTDGNRSGADRAGAAIGAIAGSMNGPGSYGANNPSPTPGGVNRGISESGAMGGAANSGVGISMPGASGSSSWLDWIGPAITAGSALYGQHQANNATDAATRAANAEQARQFDLVRSDTAPTRALGAAAVGRLGALNGYTSDTGTPDMSQFYTSPDYQFRLGEGQKAIDNSAAARSGLLSGAAVKQGIRFNSGTASGEYGAFVDRLMQQAGLGNTGIGASAAAGANSANNISANTINAGNARASGYMDTAANVSNAANQGIGNYMLRRYLGG